MAEALDDIQAVLDTDDIATEQKMTARLKRAGMLRHGRQSDALSDLGE